MPPTADVTVKLAYAGALNSHPPPPSPQPAAGEAQRFQSGFMAVSK